MISLLQNAIVSKGTYQCPMTPVFERSDGLSGNFKDKMQLFTGDICVHDGTAFAYYTANSDDGDVDRIFGGYKTDNGSLLGGWQKHVDGNGFPVIMLNVGNEGPGAPSTSKQVFIHCVYYDEEFGEFRMYYKAQAVSGFDFTCLATSQDGLSWTKQGAVFTSEAYHIGWFVMVKVAPNDYRAIVSRRYVPLAYEHSYATSQDGVNWTDNGVINVTEGIGYISGLEKIDNYYYIIVGNDYDPDPHPPVAQGLRLITTRNFQDFTDLGVIYTALQPAQRGVGIAQIISHNNRAYIYSTVYYNRNKYSGNGGEPFTEPYLIAFNQKHLRPGHVRYNFPQYVHRYFPLYHREEDGNFYELIQGGGTGVLTEPSWTPLKYLRCQEGGVSFKNNNIIRSTEDLQIKINVQIVTGYTQELLRVASDIIISIENGYLRVRLNNGTKDYITNNIIEKQGGTDPGTATAVGFIFRGGVLMLCYGDQIDVSVTKTIDAAMTHINDSGNDIVLGDNNTTQMRSVVLMSGATDQEWIDLDL